MTTPPRCVPGRCRPWRCGRESRACQWRVKGAGGRHEQVGRDSGEQKSGSDKRHSGWEGRRSSQESAVATFEPDRATDGSASPAISRAARVKGRGRSVNMRRARGAAKPHRGRTGERTGNGPCQSGPPTTSYDSTPRHRNHYSPPDDCAHRRRVAARSLVLARAPAARASAARRGASTACLHGARPQCTQHAASQHAASQYAVGHVPCTRLERQRVILLVLESPGALPVLSAIVSRGPAHTTPLVQCRRDGRRTRSWCRVRGR